VLKDITLGQFFPGDTPMHRLDPRTKILLLIVYIVALFSSKSFSAYAVILTALTVCTLLAKLKPKTMLSGIKPLLIIIIFTGILNIFYTNGTVIAEFWIFSITREGLRAAAFMILRIMLLVFGTLLMTYTTSPISLTDGLERLLSPLKKIKLPIHELSMMMSIALRFIPTLIEETDKIMSAQKARGADFETGGLIKRARALLPLLVPLFISAFRRAEELATAMESRCYHGDDGRTRMKSLHFSELDYIAFAGGILLLAAVFVLRGLGI